ncbi:MAG: PaaI family thioesterase [Deltaproteobacteria bacterium]|nr:PaaI family thioesterase [Deltaproteobacteria bacterium]MBW2069832.1 PaaI family thioesterase [Deltaproteobacteria bacterium]
MEQTALSRLRRHIQQEPYAASLGIKLRQLEQGRAVVEMTCTAAMENIFQMTHGGAIFSLIDEAFQAACNSHGTVAVALNINVTYHRAAVQGCTLLAEAREVHRTRRTASYHITVLDHQQRLVASCQALAYRKAEPHPFIDKDRHI